MEKRSRTGCVTCRKRRIKCDEAKPTCRRCRTANFHCEGYAPLQRISGSSPTQASTSRAVPNPPGVMVDELPWRHVNWRQDQLPLYHHFVTSTVYRLFRIDHVGFWRDQVAQISYGSDIVYEALLAVGAAHRASLLSCSKTNAQEAKRLKVLGLRSYGKTLHLLASNLNQNISTGPLAVPVVLLLLAYFECFMENHIGAFRHLWAAIQVLRRSEGHLSVINVSNMIPVYEVILRLDFLAQKLVPYSASSFSRGSNLALMELPFWNRETTRFSTTAQSDPINTERHRLIQLICGHNKISRVVWGGWYPTSERPSRDELMAFYAEMMLWKGNSPATFASSHGLDTQVQNIAEFSNLPIPPPLIQLSSSEAAVNVIMFNGYLGCAVALIGATDEDPTAREIEAFNLVYQNLSVIAGLIGNVGQTEGSYEPCDAINMGISILLYHGARRCFSLSWQEWTTAALRSIGREGLSNGHASANAIEIMGRLQTSQEASSPRIGSPLGPIRDRPIPLLMPRDEDEQFSAYYLRNGPTDEESDVRIVAKATWKQHESGNMESFKLDTYDFFGHGETPLSEISGSLNVVLPWRQSVEHGWHNFLPGATDPEEHSGELAAM